MYSSSGAPQKTEKQKSANAKLHSESSITLHHQLPLQPYPCPMPQQPAATNHIPKGTPHAGSGIGHTVNQAVFKNLQYSFKAAHCTEDRAFSRKHRTIVSVLEESIFIIFHLQWTIDLFSLYSLLKYDTQRDEYTRKYIKIPHFSLGERYIM